MYNAEKTEPMNYIERGIIYSHPQSLLTQFQFF